MPQLALQFNRRIISYHSIKLRCASQQNRTAEVRSGSKADVTILNFDVRFTPESGHSLQQSECPLWANTELMHRSTRHPYSITSSATASNDGGTSRPSALAVLRLITNSNLVD